MLNAIGVTLLMTLVASSKQVHWKWQDPRSQGCRQESVAPEQAQGVSRGPTGPSVWSWIGVLPIAADNLLPCSVSWYGALHLAFFLMVGGPLAVHGWKQGRLPGQTLICGWMHFITLARPANPQCDHVNLLLALQAYNLSAEEDRTELFSHLDEE